MKQRIGVQSSKTKLTPKLILALLLHVLVLADLKDLQRKQLTKSLKCQSNVIFFVKNIGVEKIWLLKVFQEIGNQ
jgi:lipopolysaccharide export system protein LptC